MRRILVVQLCRLGDLLQTTPMLRGLRRTHPDARITLMVLDGFSRTPVPPHLYDELAILPLGRLEASVAGNWRTAWSGLREFIATLGSEPFDLVLNLTGSQVANLLSARIASSEVRGGLIARDRTRIVRHPWMAYFWSSLLARTYGCINLVDLFQWTAGVAIDGGGLEIDVPPQARASADAWLRGHGWSGEPLIALQLGASDERKRWPPERFAAMADRLPARLGTIVFVGSDAERPLVERALARLKRPALNAAGATSIRELAALLGHARLLVTNDTGPMHVATAVGTRVLDLSTGPVFVHETGPYAVGSLAVEPTAACFPCAAGAVCHHLSCRDDLTEADIAGLVLHALGEGDLVRPARARILRAGRTASGRIEFGTLWDPTGDRTGIERRALARMWEATLPVPGRHPRDDAGIETVTLDDPAVFAALDQFAARADRAASMARTVTGTGSRAQERADALGREYEAVQTQAAVVPVLQPIVAYLRTRLESATERDVARLGSIYRAEWAAAANRARILKRTLSGAGKTALAS